MKLQRVDNAKRNIVYGALNKVVALVFPFILRMIMIRTIGIQYLGLNGLFSAILQLLNLTEMGFSSVAVYCMYKPIAENDTKTVNALLNFYKKFYSSISVVITIVGLILLPCIPYFINGSVPDNVNVYILYLIYLFNTVLNYAVFSYRTTVLYAYQRNDLISIVSILTSGCLYTFQIAALLYTKSYYVYLILMPLATLLGNLIRAYLSCRIYPGYRCSGKIDSTTQKNIVKQIKGLFINKICQTSRSSFDSIFVSAFLGLGVSGIYSNYLMILNCLNGILAVLMESITAGIGNSIVTESVDKNYADMKKFNFLYMLIAGWCTVCMLCLYQPFMIFVFGKEYLLSDVVVFLFCLYFYGLCMGNVRGAYSDALGLWWQNRYRAIFESILNLILNFLFVYKFGVAGITAATLIPLMIVNFGYGSQIVFKYYFGEMRIKNYFVSHGKYALCTFIVSVTTYTLCKCTLPLLNPFGTLVKNGLICIVVPAWLFWMIYHKSSEYDIAISWVKRIFNLKK